MGKINKYATIELLVFTFLTMMISEASSIANNDIVRVFFMGVVVLYINIRSKPLYNNLIVYVLCGWIIINLLSSIYLSENIDFYPFLGKLILVYTAYLVLISIDGDFWEKYEKFLYKIVLISFVIYLSSLMLPFVFDRLTPIFSPFTESFFYSKESQQHYFYAFFFVYKGGDALFRNCGFMWEPGAYAMMLIILIAYNFARNGIIFNKRIIVYVVALLTTFSTAGYLSFLVLLLLFFLKGKNLYIKILLISIALISVEWLINADFLLPKIEQYLDSAEKGEVYHQGFRQLYEANRVLSVSLLLNKFLMFPLGWGCVQDTTSYMALRNIVTINGLGNLLVTWGVLFFSFYMYSIYKFFNQYDKSVTFSIVALFAVLIAFFSNPIENNLILFILVFSPYIAKYKTVK